MPGDSDLEMGKILGALDARQSAIERRMLTLEGDVKGWMERIDGRLDEIHEKVSQAQGGWKVLTVIGSIAATIAAIAIGFLAWWKK